MISLGLKPLTRREIVEVARNGVQVELSAAARERICKSRAVVDKYVKESIVAYGITTGVGKLCNTFVTPEQAAQLQVNLSLSHSCGVGKRLSEEESRAVMVIRVNNFARGCSGISLPIVEKMVEMLNLGLNPVLPEGGGVGSSGSLSTGGHMALAITGRGEICLLPVTMREMVFDTVGQPSSYGRIYPAIQKLGVDTQSNAGNYLNVYFEKYDKKLEQFIAHFERPRNLIGIIVLVDGEIVAVDKFPSFTYAEQVWDLMIRDCYGSLAIISELKHKSTMQNFTETFNDLKKSHQENIIDLLERSLRKTKKSITDSVQEKIQELLNLTFDATLDAEGNPSARTNAPKSYMLKTEGYVGQVITENEFNHMVSIVKRERFDPNALRAVNELRNKARKQDRFSL